MNCYFVEEHDGLTLIDAGMSFCFKGIMQAAVQIDKPICRIVLTHAHEDHVGALDALKDKLPEIPVYISHRDSALLGGDRSLQALEPHTPIRGSVPRKVSTRADGLLHDGDRIGSLLAVAVPGHTPGSMAFLDTRNHMLIAGDAFQTRGGIAVSGHLKPWFPFPALATWHKASALESAIKLRNLQPSALAVGHGKMLLDPLPAMEKAINEAEAGIRME